MLTCFEAVDSIIYTYNNNFSLYNSPGGGGAVYDVFGLDDMTGYTYYDKNTGITHEGALTIAQVRDVWRSGDTEHELWPVVQNMINGSPIFWVDEDDPAFFIYHGTNDVLCPIQQATEMFEALCRAGVDCVYRICEGMGHGAYTHPQYYTEMMEWLVSQANSGTR